MAKIPIVQVAIADLLLDDRNPRLLGQGGATQQELALVLLQQVGVDSLLRLAKDILDEGIDPLMLTAVLPTGDKRGKRYRVLEGNRRLLALMALEAPSLVSPVLRPFQVKRLNGYSAQYASAPVEELNCALFEKREDADHWLLLRHTGLNKGVGLMGWGNDEQDLFNAHVKGKRSRAGQVRDFVEAAGLLSEDAKASDRKVTTTVQRMADFPYWREKVGIDRVRGDIVALYPKEEVAKGLTRLVEDLLTGKLNVSDFHQREGRVAYADSLRPKDRPKRSTKLPEPVLLADLTAGKAKPTPVQRPSRRAQGTKTRTTVIPAEDRLTIDPPRINEIYTELGSLNAEKFTNAAAVLLRVFIELSVDQFIEQRSLMTEEALRNAPLGKKLREAVDHMHQEGDVSGPLKRAIHSVASGNAGVLAPSVPTFHLYVHNQYAFPKPSELYRAWTELSPFLEQIWR